MLDVPVAFFNRAHVKKIGTEKVLFLELLQNEKLIERCRIILTPSAMRELKTYLEELDNGNEHSIHTKVTNYTGEQNT